MNICRVLVLDDDIGVCTVLSRILQDQQYDVHTSQSVASAAETLAERSFDAYLLDYRLPDGTGLQVAKMIRQQGSNAPVVLISGYGTTDIAAEAGALDIFEVLQKPFTRETICNTLERALNHAPYEPVPVPQQSAESGIPEPRFRVQVRALHVILIVVALLFLAFCIYLIFR